MFNLCWLNLPHSNNIEKLICNWIQIKFASLVDWSTIICKYVDWLCQQVQHSNISCKLGWLSLPKSNNIHILCSIYVDWICHNTTKIKANVQVMLSGSIYVRVYTIHDMHAHKLCIQYAQHLFCSVPKKIITTNFIFWMYECDRMESTTIKTKALVCRVHVFWQYKCF